MFSNLEPSFELTSNKYNGEGWISASVEALKDIEDISIGYVFLGNRYYHIVHENVDYYSIPIKRRGTWRYLKMICGFNYMKVEEKQWQYYKGYFKSVVEDFRPELIHVFGSEKQLGLVCDTTSIPVLIHVQGLLNPYFNAYLPPFISWKELTTSVNPYKLYQIRALKYDWLCRCYRERHILSSVKYFLGRTEWDKRLIFLFNEKSKYYYCSEILRDVFYKECKRINPTSLNIVSTISGPLYKGYDLILKTAYILKTILNIEFEWKVFGNINPRLIEKTIGLKHDKLNVNLCGVANAIDIRDHILNSTCYVHSSYIDNSPNSVCEAMILGCPVIVTNVGGTASLIEEGSSGFSVPSNDPFQTAFLILKLYKDRELNEIIGNNARIQAIQRHDKKQIIDNLVGIYKEIIEKNANKK